MEERRFHFCEQKTGVYVTPTNTEPEHMSFLNHQITLLYQPIRHLLLALHHLVNRQERTKHHNVKRRVFLGGMNAKVWS